ncbi:MAG: hypothetical protein WB762_01665 [Candidatus Sulfotelmatobacter sp.]
MASPSNVPGARFQTLSWTDSSGNFWFFGGDGPISNEGVNQFYNDLWKYSGGQWTWMSGSNAANQAGTYGTQGTPASTNAPGARTDSVDWTDASGNLWLFAGAGVDSAGTSDDLNDLWKYEP